MVDLIFVVIVLAAIRILILIVLHRIIWVHHIRTSKSWVSIWRLELLHTRVVAIMLLLKMRRFVWWSLVCHLYLWNSWDFTRWLVGVHASWAPHLSYLYRYIIWISIHDFSGALTWWNHRWSGFCMSWRHCLWMTLGGAHFVCVLHLHWHGHLSLSFRLGLWFDPISTLQEELIVLILNNLLRQLLGIGVIISVDLLNGHEIILDVFEVLSLELFGFLKKRTLLDISENKLGDIL